LKWTFEVYLDDFELEKYGFHFNLINDLSLILFAQLKEEAEAAQMVEVNISGKLFWFYLLFLRHLSFLIKCLKEFFKLLHRI